MSENVHEDRETLEKYLKWLTQKSSWLMKAKHPHKNHWFDLLLGIGLFFRDSYLAFCIDHDETPVPPYVQSSCMEDKDSKVVGEVVKILLHAIDLTLK